MSIPGAASPLFIGAAAAAEAGYQIDRSLRFNDDDGAKLTRTFSAGNQSKWTWSGWVKRSSLGTKHHLFAIYTASNNGGYFRLAFNSDNTLFVGLWSKSALTTDAVYRDLSAWMHIVLAMDLANSTADDRLILYVNGVRQSVTLNIGTDTSYAINSAGLHNIGSQTSTSQHFDGYMTEVHFVDGAQLAASDFGEYDNNNVWQPKEFSGSHNQGGSGTIYSDDLTTNTGTFASGSSAADAFDGDTGQATRANAVLSADNYVEFEPSTPISFTNGVYVRCYAANGYNITNYYSVDLNGNGLGSETTFTGGSAGFNDVAWIQVATGSGTLHKVRIRITRSGGDTSAGITAIAINGTDSSNVLVDGTPGGANGFYLKFADNSSNAALGTDSSGNSNSWSVNNLTAREEKWSNYLTSSASFAANQGPDKAFDNSLSGADVPYNDSSASMTWAPPGGLAYSSKVEIYVGGISGFTYSLNGASAVSATTNAWNTVATGSGTINTLVFDRGINETHGPHAIRVDNVVLVDGTPSNTDSLIDTPTNYTSASGNNGGNYATFNSLNHNTHSAYYTLSNGNLKCVAVGGSSKSSGSRGFCVSTIGMSSGKYYFELTVDLDDNNDHAVGIATAAGTGYYSTAGNWTYAASGSKFANSGSAVSYGASYGDGDTIGVAFDADTGALVFYKNGSSQGTLATVTAGETYFFVWGTDAGTAQDYEVTANFGQRPFAYSVPSGYKALCTTNLPTPTIADGSTASDTVLYTGNGSTQSITGLGFSPDFVWLKGRNVAYHHRLFDAIRGQSSLSSDRTNAEGTSGNSSLTSFDTNGFSITQTSDESYNQSTKTYVGWAWDAGSSTVSNTDGSITSSVRANQSAGFSIVSYQGNGSTSSPSIGHGLNASLGLVIIKNRDGSQTYPDWYVKHKDIGDNYNTRLNLTAGRELATGSGSWYQGGIGNLTSSSVITFVTGSQSSTGNVNTNGNNYIAYCFAPVEGYSAFGSYTGNGSSDGPFVFTGMRPRWLLIKATSGTVNWYLYDTARSEYNVTQHALKPNNTDAEGSTSNKLDILSNGFKWRNSGTSTNVSGVEYIWAAFASHPFKTARAR